MNTRKEKIRQIFDEMNNLRRDDFAYYDIKRNVFAILEELNGLIAEEPDDQEKIQYRQTYLELAHTDSKEVEYVKYHEDLMRKKNVAKVREQNILKLLKTRIIKYIWI